MASREVDEMSQSGGPRGLRATVAGPPLPPPAVSPTAKTAPATAATPAARRPLKPRDPLIPSPPLDA